MTRLRDNGARAWILYLAAALIVSTGYLAGPFNAPLVFLYAISLGRGL